MLRILFFRLLIGFPLAAYNQQVSVSGDRFHLYGTFSASWEYGGKPRFTSGSWELPGKDRLAILLHSGSSFYRIIRPSGQKLVLEPENASGSNPQTLYFYQKEP